MPLGLRRLLVPRGEELPACPRARQLLRGCAWPLLAMKERVLAAGCAALPGATPLRKQPLWLGVNAQGAAGEVSQPPRSPARPHRGVSGDTRIRRGRNAEGRLPGLPGPAAGAGRAAALSWLCLTARPLVSHFPSPSLGFPSGKGAGGEFPAPHTRPRASKGLSPPGLNLWGRAFPPTLTLGSPIPSSTPQPSRCGS